MQIHQVGNSNARKRKRVARGGKRGTYSGRGMKGQKSRSGASVDPLFEGGRSSLIDRLKKIKGFKSIKPKKIVLGLEDLEALYEEGETVSVNSLIEKGLLKKKNSLDGVKILSNGKISKKLTFEKGILFSESSKNAIIKAGGKIEEEKK